MIATGVLLLALVSSGAPLQPAERDKLGWHVVRPGDTLEEITRFYLGTPDLWRENWNLNPSLADPDMLRVGARLRVILERVLPARTAEVTRVSRRVEHKPQPEPWISAEVGSLLKERDGLRTFPSSSAELRLEDDSRLTITEESLVFLREMRATVGGPNRESIEIVEGQAEVEAQPGSRGASDIEILIGGTVARPSREANKVAKTRARRPDAGGASVMVYGGEAEVSAGGALVEVGEGMGTAVPEGGVPADPEKLLGAPRAQGPARGSSWNVANPPFRWNAVDNASSYTVEICADARCSALVERVTGIEETEWLQASLQRGDYHWRVTAVSVSGLDGYPSASSAVSVTSERQDLEAPVVVGVIRGLGTVSADGTMSLGDAAGIALLSRDDASGVARIRYRWNGGTWRTYGSRVVQLPDTGPETNRLEVSATDLLGRESQPWGVDVVRDLDAPPPPAVSIRPSRPQQ